MQDQKKYFSKPVPPPIVGPDERDPIYLKIWISHCIVFYNQICQEKNSLIKQTLVTYSCSSRSLNPSFTNRSWLALQTYLQKQNNNYSIQKLQGKKIEQKFNDISVWHTYPKPPGFASDSTYSKVSTGHKCGCIITDARRLRAQKPYTAWSQI